MKQCLICQRTYSDETLKFCRADGTELSAAINPEEAPTASFESPLQQDQPLQTAIIEHGKSAQLPHSGISSRPSLAVLPFTPLGPGSGDDYLGLGMADTLITRLSRINRINVRPTSSIIKYADQKPGSIEAGREQNVDAVLEGSIQRAGEKIRITARLINVRDGVSLWGYQRDEESKDIFEVEDSITEQIATSLLENLSREEESLLSKRHTESVEAFHLYLKGRYHWNRFTERGIKKAIEYFNQAVEKDPAYALAYAGLADCYGVLGVNYLAPKDILTKAKAAVLRALEIDETLSEAHSTLGALTLFYEWDLPTAQRELRHAIDLNIGSANAYQLYAYYQQVIGRPDDGVALLEQSLEVDPLSPILNADLAWAHNNARQYDQALEQGLKTLEIDPNFAMGHVVIGMAYAHKGLQKKAIKEFAKAVKLSNGSPRILAWLGYSYAKAGNPAKAQEILERLVSQSKERPIDPYNIAVVQVGLGDKEAAFESLEKAYKDRSGQLIFLKVDPVLDSLRADLRFTDLMTRLGLTVKQE